MKEGTLRKQQHKKIQEVSMRKKQELDTILEREDMINIHLMEENYYPVNHAGRLHIKLY